MVRGLWKAALYFVVLFFGRKKPYNKGEKIELFYGGARSRGVGGPIVKVHRLKKHFPQKFESVIAVHAKARKHESSYVLAKPVTYNKKVLNKCV